MSPLNGGQQLSPKKGAMGFHTAAQAQKNGNHGNAPGDLAGSMCSSVEARELILTTGSHGMRLPLAEDAISPTGSRCQRCEVLPNPVQGPGTLHLRFPLTHCLKSVTQALYASPWNCTEEAGILRVQIPEADLTPALDFIALVMTLREREDTKVFFVPRGQQPTLDVFFDITSLERFHALSRSEWLLDILRERRLYSAFQPIVCSQDISDVLGYECLMRATSIDGQPIGAGQLMSVARGAGLMFQLDLEARRVAFTSAAEYGITGKVFVNFGPTAIYDPDNCLKSTLQLIDEVGLKHEQIVFEVIEVDHVGDDAQLERIVGYYREHGFGVALDDLGAGYSSLLLLHRLQPDYIKLDRELTRGVHRDRSKAVLASKMLDVAHDLGLLTIAEGVEMPEEYEWVREHGADFIQGYYIARPATPPPLL